MDIDKANNLTGRIISSAIEVHRHLGPGMLERCYQTALMVELGLRGIRAEMEVPIPFFYKGVKIETSFRADIIVEDSIILELKATEADNAVFAKQLLSYLRLSGKELGLVLNFNRPLLTEGIERVINTIRR